jgi:hypothetical protein
VRRWQALGLLGAAALSVTTIGGQYRRQQDPHIVYDRFRLPAFDAHVYVGMAERPGVFTVAPWGYRVLTPLLARAVPDAGLARGFTVVTLAALALATFFTYLWLRRLGNGIVAALVATAVFGLSPPVALAIRYPFMTEPLTILLLVSFLLGVECGVGLPMLALLAVLGALTKELLLWPLPLLLVAAWRRHPGRGAFVRAALAAAPALVVTFLLRSWWMPPADEASLGATLRVLPTGLELILVAWREWWRPLLLMGLMPLALLGALRRRSWPFLVRYGWLALAFLALPFAAGIYVAEAALPTEFFSGDVPRLMLYVIPFALPLALTALDRVVPLQSEPAPPRAWPGAVQWAAGALAAAIAVIPLGALDHYRRVDLRHEREGPYVLATLRETWRTAERLANGARVVFSPERGHWVPGVSDAPLMSQMRWYLFSGWGRKAYYGVHDIVMRERTATLLLPLLQPHDLEVELRLVAHPPEPVEILVNGWSLATTMVPDEAATVKVAVPANVLFRGDNLLTLRRSHDGLRGPRLLEYAIQAKAG